MNDQHYFIFRQPETFDELKALLLLRYRVFRESRLEKFVPENSLGIDLDCWDLYSRHFGLYEHHGVISRPIGYIRMITEEPGTFRDDLFELSKLDPDLHEKVNRTPPKPFPLLDYCPDATVVQRYHEDLRSQGDWMIEASRLSLDRSARGAKMSDFRMAQAFIAAVYASFLSCGVTHCVVSCNANHDVLYSGFGARALEGSGKWFNGNAGVWYSLLLLEEKNLPASVQVKVSDMRKAYETFGRICYNPSDPDDYYAPLGSYVESRPVFTAIAA